VQKYAKDCVFPTRCYTGFVLKISFLRRIPCTVPIRIFFPVSACATLLFLFSFSPCGTSVMPSASIRNKRILCCTPLANAWYAFAKQEGIVCGICGACFHPTTLNASCLRIYVCAIMSGIFTKGIIMDANDQEIELVRKWAASPEGKKTMQRALARSLRLTARLQEARRVHQKSLYKPFTI